MNRRLIILIVFLLPQILFAQDPEFSQFFANPLNLNPAFTGTTELPRAILNYRNQWPQKGTTYITYSASYDQISKKLNTGFGFQVIHDRELNNVINSSSATFSYSYHIKFDDRKFMNLGLVTSSEINNFSDEKKLFPDFAVGALGQQNDFFWGVGVHHLTQPNESIIEGDQKGKLPIKVTLHVGARSRKLHYGLLSREYTISPNILYQQQGSFKQLNLGIYMIEKSFLFGGWFRDNFDIRPDAIILLAGFAREKFQLGYSFDLTLSKLSNYSYGSHEISVTFFIGQKSLVPVRDKLLIPMI